MATKKRQQTMAKREREQNVRDRRTEKLLKKRTLAAERNAEPEEFPAVAAELGGATEESPAGPEQAPDPS